MSEFFKDTSKKIYVTITEKDYCKKCVYVLYDRYGICRCSRHDGTALIPMTCPNGSRKENPNG
ncbi:hypothetical protein AUJ83_00175 [Candidatus Woesearchaeota archaeon CG1_02_33_12]|nr:MAG: hypothetical protein AUJ83_00175 [Candidatus Woesearchaeota archaeon CG1_02_33_12]